jgi:hypothetical protein
MIIASRCTSVHNLIKALLYYLYNNQVVTINVTYFYNMFVRTMEKEEKKQQLIILMRSEYMYYVAI